MQTLCGSRPTHLFGLSLAKGDLFAKLLLVTRAVCRVRSAAILQSVSSHNATDCATD